jgi:Flp pilus assembly protein TadD
VNPDKPISSQPYLKTSEALIHQWQRTLATEQRPIIGINWQGNPDHEQTISKGRSLPLEVFAPLAELQSISLVTLQKGFGSEQLEQCAFKNRFVACQEQVNQAWDFLETAAIIANCDLIITSDTSVAHLAAGLGKTTWLLLMAIPEWRWGLEGDTSFWYPSMRIFRQREQDNWPEVLQRVAAALPPWIQTITPAQNRSARGTHLDDQAMDGDLDPAIATIAPQEAALEQQAQSWIKQGNFEAAETIYQKLIATGNQNPITYSNLAAICHLSGRTTEMIALLRQALALKPDFPEALSNLGIALQEQGDLEGAITSYQEALRYKPDSAEALSNLGTLLKDQGNLEGAIECFDKALSAKPDYAEAHFNRANVLEELGDVDGATTAYETALLQKENYPEAHKNFSMLLLLKGDYQQGWQRYEWRFNSPKDPSPLHAKPKAAPWDGKHLLPNDKLLIVSEQGFGDMLQFMRYALPLKQQGVAVSLCAQPKLHGLIQASGIDDHPITPEQANAVADGYWIPLLSLPKYLGVTPSNPIVTEPYLNTSDQLVSQWRDILATERRPIIGINWQGNPEHEKTNSLGRSLPLEAFGPLADIPAISLLSLQKGYGSEQWERCSFKDRFVSCQKLVNETWDFLETAAIIVHCDLVITSDTAVAHLAAGLGKPTWLLLKSIPEWRWGLKGETSFWYPSMRLFRQRERGNWNEVLERVALELRHYLEAEY